MNTEANKTGNEGLNDDASELLSDFRASPHYYHRWLMYANDRLLEQAIENKDSRSESLQCMQALKHIRTLLVSMQEQDPFEE